MIASLYPELTNLGLVLASKSPRRVEILTNLGLVPEVCPSSFEENLDKKCRTPSQYVCDTSRGKGIEVFNSKSSQGFRGIVISADTVVI
jgi:septum formation protein